MFLFLHYSYGRGSPCSLLIKGQSHYMLDGCVVGLCFVENVLRTIVALACYCVTGGDSGSVCRGDPGDVCFLTPYQKPHCPVQMADVSDVISR